MIEVNELAKALHESNRKAVESGNVIRKLGSLNEETGEVTAPKPIKFFEWDELDETGKEGKRISARYLLEHFNILPQKEIANYEEWREEFLNLLGKLPDHIDHIFARFIFGTGRKDKDMKRPHGKWTIGGSLEKRHFSR